MNDSEIADEVARLRERVPIGGLAGSVDGGLSPIPAPDNAEPARPFDDASVPPLVEVYIGVDAVTTLVRIPMILVA